MTRLTDGKKIAEITMRRWDGSRYGEDISGEFFGGLTYSQDDDALLCDDLDYCIEQAQDWYDGRGDFADEPAKDDGYVLDIDVKRANPLTSWMTFAVWKNLVRFLDDIQSAEWLFNELAGLQPEWVNEYTGAELMRICEAALATWNGISELLAFLGMTQAAFADRYGFAKRTVESWCSGTEASHRDCPENVLMLVSYTALRDAGII